MCSLGVMHVREFQFPASDPKHKRQKLTFICLFKHLIHVYFEGITGERRKRVKVTKAIKEMWRGQLYRDSAHHSIGDTCWELFILPCSSSTRR